MGCQCKLESSKLNVKIYSSSSQRFPSLWNVKFMLIVKFSLNRVMVDHQPRFFPLPLLVTDSFSTFLVVRIGDCVCNVLRAQCLVAVQ